MLSISSTVTRNKEQNYNKFRKFVIYQSTFKRTVQISTLNIGYVIDKRQQYIEYSWDAGFASPLCYT